MLREVRLGKGLFQNQLAELAGTTPAVINYIENGHRYPTKKIRQNIEAVVGEVDWIMTRLQGAIISGYPENETTEDQITKAVFSFISSAQTVEQGYCFDFLKALLNQMELKFKTR